MTLEAKADALIDPAEPITRRTTPSNRRRPVESTFVAQGPNGTVPARLYIPPDSEAMPLVLIGHGGAASKDTPRFVDLSRRYATALGLPVLMIDGPAHGDRAPSTGSRDSDYRVVQRAQVSHDVANQLALDWAAASATARELAPVGEPVAYMGISMGAMLGPTVVATIKSIKAAVFVAGGIPRPGGLAELTREVEGDWAAEIIREVHGEEERRWPIEDAAPQLGHCDVLMLNTSDDVVFPVDRVFRLFSEFPGGKRVVFWPGAHGHLPDEAFELSFVHIRRVLGLASSR